MVYSRRDFIKTGLLTGCSLCGRFESNPQVLADSSPQHKRPLFATGEYKRIDAKERAYHISCSPDMFDLYEDLAEIWRAAGVTDAWLCTWFYGYFPYTWEKLDHCLDLIQRAGLRPHLISVPFCHGGGALDPRSEGFPNLPPEHWKRVQRWDGTEQWGFSWHQPADSEGAQAIKTLYERYGVFDYFLDDDFRFAASPGVIGGCVCDQCRSDFLTKFGYRHDRWNDVIDDVRNSSETEYLHAWVDFFCDRMTQCFRTYQSAVPEIDLGIMVMYMGCERAGIRLEDYKDVLFRVGEGCFNDGWYGATKNKTIELYSSLFHRRFCQPGRSFSETTVFPERSLSAVNMASKLSISTICDVRNTCFMSGLVPIDPGHWSTLGVRMKREREMHARLVGARLAGPFKHYYGVSSRYCSGENPYSLFLALGTPFEVCDELPKDGWIFLSDADARASERGALDLTNAKFFARFESGAGRFQKLSEDFDSLFQFRRSILVDLQKGKIPYVEEEIPIVLAWYPDVNAVYIWNPEEKEVKFHVRRGDKLLSMCLAALDSTYVDLGALE